MNAPRCEWAACDQAAVIYVDGYWHCRPHLREHHQLTSEEYAAAYGRRPRPGVLHQPDGAA